jgi:hypothetical protein
LQSSRPKAECGIGANEPRILGDEAGNLLEGAVSRYILVGQDKRAVDTRTLRSRVGIITYDQFRISSLFEQR